MAWKGHSKLNCNVPVGLPGTGPVRWTVRTWSLWCSIFKTASYQLFYYLTNDNQYDRFEDIKWAWRKCWDFSKVNDLERRTQGSVMHPVELYISVIGNFISWSAPEFKLKIMKFNYQEEIDLKGTNWSIFIKIWRLNITSWMHWLFGFLKRKAIKTNTQSCTP